MAFGDIEVMGSPLRTFIEKLTGRETRRTQEVRSCAGKRIAEKELQARRDELERSLTEAMKEIGAKVGIKDAGPE